MDQPRRLKDLEIFAIMVSFSPSEKELGQKMVISASLSHDMTKVATELDFGQLLSIWRTVSPVDDWFQESTEDLD